LVASRITDELNCRDQMQIVHIVITSCTSIIYKVETGGTHRCNPIKEIKYIDIGYSFVNQSYGLGEILFQRIEPIKDSTHACMHAV